MVQGLIENCCSFTQGVVQPDFLPLRKKAVQLFYILTPTLRRIFMAACSHPITDDKLANEDVEEEDEDEDTQKNGDDSDSDSNRNDEKQGNCKVVDNRAELNCHDNWVDAGLPHAATVRPEEHETIVGHIGNEGGNNRHLK